LRNPPVSVAAIHGALALSALSLAVGLHIRVEQVKWMTLLAVGAWWPIRMASPKVLAERHRLKVGRVDAVAIEASACPHMIEGQLLGDRADQQLIGIAVGLEPMIVSTDLPIAIRITRAGP